MKKFILNFNGVIIEIEPSISLESLLLKNGTKFRFRGSDYVVEELMVDGIEEQSIIDIKRKEQHSLNDCNSDYSEDAIEIYIKMKKV